MKMTCSLLDVLAIAVNQVRWEDSLGGLAALQTKAGTFVSVSADCQSSEKRGFRWEETYPPDSSAGPLGLRQSMEDHGSKQPGCFKSSTLAHCGRMCA